MFHNNFNLQFAQFLDKETMHMENQFCKAKQMYTYDPIISPSSILFP